MAASSVALFGLGLGRNFSFVAATAVRFHSTASYERGSAWGSTTCLQA